MSTFLWYFCLKEENFLGVIIRNQPWTPLGYENNLKYYNRMNWVVLSLRTIEKPEEPQTPCLAVSKAPPPPSCDSNNDWSFFRGAEEENETEGNGLSLGTINGHLRKSNPDIPETRAEDE